MLNERVSIRLVSLWPCLMKRKWSGIERVVKCSLTWLFEWQFMRLLCKRYRIPCLCPSAFLTESQCLLEQAACGLASAGDHMTKSHSGACTAMETSHECPTKCDTTVDPVCSNANVTYSLCPLQSMQSSIKRNILYFLTKNYFDTNSDFSHFFISQKTHVSWSRLTVDFWNTTTPHT